MAFSVQTSFEDARSANESALKSAIEALRSDFQARRTQIEGQKGITQANLGRAVSLLARQQGLASEALTGQSLQRGILRSGIYARDDARLRQGYAEQEADTRGQAASTLSDLEAALGLLGPQEQAAVGGVTMQAQERIAALAKALAEMNALAPSPSVTTAAPLPAPTFGTGTVQPLTTVQPTAPLQTTSYVAPKTATSTSSSSTQYSNPWAEILGLNQPVLSPTKTTSTPRTASRGTYAI